MTSRSFRWAGAAGQVLLLIASGAVALLLGETLVRMAKPGFPGFRIPQVEHRPTPGLGFEMIPNQRAYTAAERVIINDLGLRGPAVRRHPDPFDLRVLCIGDSITFGYGVGEEAPFPRQLEGRLLNRWPNRRPEVINAGVQRYFTYQEVDFLRDRGLALTPDVVILAVYPNDLGVRPPGDYIRIYEKERERAASAFRNKVPAVYLFLKNSALVDLAKGAYLSFSSGGGVLRMFEGRLNPRDEERWQAFEEELATVAKLARDHDFVPLVAAIPARAQVVTSYPSSLFPARLLQASERQGIEAIDLLPVLQDSLRRGTDPYLPWDNHLSPAGHALVAAELDEALARLLPAAAPTSTQQSREGF